MGTDSVTYAVNAEVQGPVCGLTEGNQERFPGVLDIGVSLKG